MAKNNATCAICGSGYYLCMSCQDNMQLRPWKLHTDTSEHFKVYQILRAYNSGVYNKTEARNALKNVDISDKDTYLCEIREMINNILAVSKPAKKNNKTIKTSKKQRSADKNSEQ